MTPIFCMVYIIIIALVIALDRFLKIQISLTMNPGDSISIIGDFFRITSLRNTGAAFSLFSGHLTALTIIPGIIIVLAIIFLIKRRNDIKPLTALSIALICAGGIGNLYDRLMYGYVIDMFDFGSFPVFNIADIAVCVGCVLLLLQIAFGEKDE